MQEMKDVQLKPVRKVWVDYVKVLGMQTISPILFQCLIVRS